MSNWDLKNVIHSLHLSPFFHLLDGIFETFIGFPSFFSFLLLGFQLLLRECVVIDDLFVGLDDVVG